MDEMSSKSRFKIHQKLFNTYPPRQHPWMYLLFSLIILGVLWLVFGAHKQKQAIKKPITVVSEVATSADVPIYLFALGNVTPIYTVTVKTQINGQLQKVLFKEGQQVKAGELLAQIDPRPYEALLTQYEGNLERDLALLANAKIDLKRYDTLWKQNSTSQQIYATQKSLVQQYEGAVKIDEGLIQGTKVNLIYTRISSPIDGRIGLRLVDQGNFVQTTDTSGIAVINTLEPITVLFTLPEDSVPQLMPQFYAHKNLNVKAYDRQQNQLLAEGTLLSVDNQIDLTTGTYRLKGQFANKDNKLFPNQFVNMKILVETLKKATLVPTSAIQFSTKNNFVYAIYKDSLKVSAVPVVTGPTQGEVTVIKNGIVPGQLVVTGGADKLKNGMQVVLGQSVHSDKPPPLHRTS